MLIAKLKLGAIAALAGLVAVVTCCALTPIGVAQDQSSPPQAAVAPKPPLPKAETDQEFIRRVSLELRGVESNRTEIHFFVTSKQARKQHIVGVGSLRQDSARGVPHHRYVAA